MRSIYLKFLLTLLVPALCLAEAGEIQIRDTSGFTRAVSEVEDQGSVEFEVMDASGNPAEGVTVTLTNVETGKVLKSSAVSGLVLFDSVSPGIWVVSTTDSAITFTGIVVSSGAIAGSSVGAAAAVITAAGGSAAAIAQVGDDRDEDTPPLSPAS